MRICQKRKNRYLYLLFTKITVGSSGGSLVATPDCKTEIQQSPQLTVDCCPEMGCHLGQHFAVGCPLRGSRGKI
jgi:hypothetical protein